MRNAFLDELVRIAQADPSVWLLSADLGFSVLEPFIERFPERYVNVGIAEQNMIGLAAGLAHSGKKVVCYSIVNFAVLRCLEQIRNDVCCHDLPVTIAGVGAGYAYGTQGYTHHGLEDVSVLASLPGMRIGVPADAAEARAVLRAMVAEMPGPGYLRLEKANEPQIHDTAVATAPGRPCTLRTGEDVAILACGTLVSEAVEAAEILAREGTAATVVSVPWVKPCDAEILAPLLAGHRVVVTVEEGSTSGGLGAGVCRLVATRGLATRVVVAGVDGARPLGTVDQITARRRLGLDAQGIVDRIRAALCAQRQN